MAVSFGNIQSIVDFGPSTTITNSITLVTGVRPVMIVAGNGHSASDAITSITWNGVALTKVQVQAPTGSNDRYIYIFVLVNPDSGTHNLVINNSTSAYFFGHVAVYNGCGAVQPGTSSKSTSTAATTFTETLTINNSGSWIVGWAHHWNGNLAAGTGTTLRTAAAVTGLGDSNGPVNVGSSSIQFTGSSETWMGVYLSLLPNEEIKKINGVYMGSQEIASTRFASEAVGYWRFEDNALDETANNNDLTTGGSPAYGTGRFGKGLDLESTSSQYAGIADASQTGLDLTGDFSINLWMKFESLPANGAEMSLVTKDNTSTQRNYNTAIYNNAGTYRWYLDTFGNAGTESTYWNYNPSVDTWYHIVYTYVVANGVATAGNFYINGVSQGASTVASGATNNTSLNNCTAAFQIGVRNSAGYLDGIIDEVGVIPRVLTSDEIYSLYKTGVKKLNGQVNLNPELESTSLRGDANLVQYTRFEGNSTATVGNTGTDTNITYGTDYGKFGQGALFNGTSSKIVLPAIATQTDGTISVWVKFSNLGTDSFIISNRNLASATGYMFQLTINTSKQLTLLVRNSGNTAWSINLTSTNTMQTGQYYLVTWTWGSGGHNVYVNSNLWMSTTTTNSVFDNTNTIIIGLASDGNYPLSGNVDDYGIFSRALTSTEISNLYNTNIKKYGGVSNI